MSEQNRTGLTFGRPVRLLLASVAVAALCGASAATAGESVMPAMYQQQAAALTASCGGLRAEVIARMQFAEDIHVAYVSSARDPRVAAVAGSPAWHRWWAQTYVETIKLLKEGCS